MARTINLFHPYVPEDVIPEVVDTLHSRWIGQGNRVDRFEREYSEKFNQPYCVTVNSGTSALETAYELAGIKSGDEVIAPVLTCSATNIPLMRMGVKIVWADINKNTLCPDKNDILNKITSKTKAIVNVYLGGIGNDLGEMPVPVITDAAQALGLFGGDYLCNSFQAIKHITTGDGGMIVLNNEEEYKKAKLMRWFGIDRERKKQCGWQAYICREMTFDIDILGYKRQMTDIAAGMGIVGLRHYDEMIAHRKKIFNIYKSLLNVKVIDGKKNTYWLCTILLDNREKVVKELYDAGVDTNVVQVRNDNFSIFGGKCKLPNMDYIEDKYLSIPLNMTTTEEDAIYVCEIINNAIK